MKKLLVTMVMGLAFSAGVYAQGTINIDNLANSNPSITATNGGLAFVGGQTVLETNSFSMDVFGGPNAANLSLIVTLTGANKLDSFGGGLFADHNGGTYVVPGVPKGGIATLELRTWAGNFTSYSAAIAGGAPAGAVIFQNPTGGGGTPPASACDLTGMPALFIGDPPFGSWSAIEPQSQTALAGSTVTFTFEAYSFYGVAGQWSHNGTNVASSNESVTTPSGLTTNTITLTLTNISDRDAGGYSLVVGNEDWGYAIEANVTLTVIHPPILGFQISAGQPQLTLNGALNHNFTVQYSSNLASTNWVDLLTLTNLSSSPYPFTDPAGFGQGARFYRAVMW